MVSQNNKQHNKKTAYKQNKIAEMEGTYQTITNSWTYDWFTQP
jgi:hypothetical protein